MAESEVKKPRRPFSDYSPYSAPAMQLRVSKAVAGGTAGRNASKPLNAKHPGGSADLKSRPGGDAVAGIAKQPASRIVDRKVLI